MWPPGGNQGQSYIDTYTIPAIPGCGGQPIAAIEFTQSIQQYQSLSDLKAWLPSNNYDLPVPLVANKPAAMRIYFTPQQDVQTYTVAVTGAVSGTRTFDTYPGCTPGSQRAQISPCTSLDFYFIPQAGAEQVTVTVSDSSGNVLETENLTFNARTTQSLNLKGVRVCLSQNSISCGDPTLLLGMTYIVGTMMPAPQPVTVQITNNKIVLSLTNYINGPLTEWEDAVVDRLSPFYGPADVAADAAANQRTDYVGVYGAIADPDGQASSAYAGHALVIPEKNDRLGDANGVLYTLAHEVGHTLGQVHTGIGIPMASATPGCWAAGALSPNTAASAAWPYASNNIQSSAGLEWGFNVVLETAIDPHKTFDIMSYCDPRWISPFNYKIAITGLGGGTVASPSARILPGAPLAARAEGQGSAPEAVPAVAPTLVQGSYWQVSGSISGTTVTLNPIFTETMLGSTDPGSGTYSIQAQNASGQALYTRYFAPLISGTEAYGDSDVFSNPEFSEWIPVTAGTASIVVVDPNGNTLISQPLTGSAPIVTITSPATGFVGSGQQTISWTVQSSAATLTSLIFYSTDAGSTWQQLDETAGTSDTLDFSTLPGATAALLRVDVSDGVNTGSATSIPFSVAKKLPSTIVINAPVNGTVQPAANPVYLSGAAYDIDDGVLTGNALQWSDSVQGALGSGQFLSVNLQPGPHTITLTATDSDGNPISTTTTITLGGGRPTVNLTTTTLSTNCVSATISAMPGTQGAVLSTVQYSLDGGNTYTSIPLNALPYSFVVPGSAPATLVAVAQDLSQQTAAQSAVVNLTGTCAAGIPFASAGTPQTAPIGSAFSTPLSVHIADPSGNPQAGVVVNFAAPETGASATLSASSATTGANGVASITATANSTSGNYTVLASVPGFSTTAQFNLTNTDFTLGLQNSSLSVQHGYVGFNTISVTPLLGFNSPVTLSCSGLPKGVTCTFSPATVTPSGSTAYSTLTINAAGGASSSSAKAMNAVSGGSLALALCLLVPGFRRRGKRLGILMLLAIALVLCSANGCGGSFHPFSSSVTVTATSGSLTHSSSINLTVH